MTHNAIRILDANANRAREALRVMEDAARFVLDDAVLCEQYKQARHELAHTCRQIVGLELHRNTPSDVGTQIRTETEQNRTGVRDVATAAGKRLSEALRSIEEYLKTLDSHHVHETTGSALAQRIEQLRYTSYNLEQQLLLRLGNAQRRQMKLCVLISESLCTTHDWLDVAKRAIDGGADCIQLREKSLEAGEMLKRASKLVATAKPANVCVIVNDRPDIALLAGADGVHLGQTDLPCEQVRKLVGPNILIGVSSSRLGEAERAYRQGADYCGVGPMFPTTTKHKDTIVGPNYLREYLAWNKLPHLAIGGIDLQQLPKLIDVGVQGIAASRCVCAADDPTQVCQDLLKSLNA